MFWMQRLSWGVSADQDLGGEGFGAGDSRLLVLLQSVWGMQIHRPEAPALTSRLSVCDWAPGPGVGPGPRATTDLGPRMTFCSALFVCLNCRGEPGP